MGNNNLPWADLSRKVYLKFKVLHTHMVIKGLRENFANFAEFQFFKMPHNQKYALEIWFSPTLSVAVLIWELQLENIMILTKRNSIVINN